MSGSLELLSRTFAGSQLHLDAFGRFFGEVGFGFITQTMLAGIEGFLFGACVVGGIMFLRTRLPKENAVHSGET